MSYTFPNEASCRVPLASCGYCSAGYGTCSAGGGRSKDWKKTAAALIGTIGMVLFLFGLKTVLPIGLSSDFIRYMLTGLWIFIGAPWLFIITRLYPKV
jgi:hypothetical protein